MADTRSLDAMVLPSVEVFNCIASGRVEELSRFSCEDLRPYLPSLACCALSRGTIDEHKSAAVTRVLLDLPDAGRVTSYFKVDIEPLRKSYQDRKAANATSEEEEGEAVCVEFEGLDVFGKLEMLARELRSLSGPLETVKPSELLDCESLRGEVSDMLCSLVLRLPQTLPPVALVEALLRVQAPSELILQLAANLPAHFQQVVDALVEGGEAQDEVSFSGRRRTALLRRLCAFNPDCCQRAQQLAILSLRQPSLVLYLGLDQAQACSPPSLLCDPVLLTLTRLVLKGSAEVRGWFGQYIKLNRHKYRRMFPSALTRVRKYLSAKMAVFEAELQPGAGPAPLEEGLEEGLPPEREESEGGRDLEPGVSEEEMDTDRGPEGRGRDAEQFPAPPLLVPLSSQACLELGLLMKVFCGLKLSGLFVWKSEGYAVLKLMTGLAPPSTNCGVKLIKVMFASLLACSFLLSTKKREEAVLTWFQWLQLNQHCYDSARCGSYGDMLLMAAIHFQDRRTSLIQQLVSSTLGTTAQHVVRAGKHTDLRELFLSVFTDQVVCTQALRVPPTPGLNATMTGFYPIHCVYNLLKSHTFSNHSIPVTEWVSNQMLTSSEPLHPILPQIIEELVAAILIPPGRSMYQEAQAVYGQPCIPERLLLQWAGSGDSSPLVKILVVYYVLSYHQRWLKSLKSYSTWTGAPPPAYSPLLLSSLPVKGLVGYMRAHRDCFACLYPPMVKLVSTHLPHVVMATHWCCDAMPTSVQPSLPTALVSAALRECASSPCRALVVVRRLLQLPSAQLTLYTRSIINALSVVNSNCVPRPLQEGLCLLWESLNSVSTETLWVDTVNALCGQDSRYSLSDLVQDPLQVLRCPPHVLQCPPLVELLLRVLSGLLALCRVWVEEQGSIQSAAGPAPLPSADKEAVVQTYASLQDSAAVQMLLEACLQLRTSGDCYGSLLSVSREVQCIVCSFVHQMFIATPLLAKLVHFQGYPAVLINMMVDGVPSMHICLDFIAELLDRPQLKAQQFALQLAARLLAQFPLASASDSSLVFVKKLNSLMETVPRQGHVEVFAPLLPFLLPLCQSLPPLVEDVVLFLLRLARRHTLEEPGPSAARALDSPAVQQAVCQLFSCHEQMCSQEHVRQDRNAMTCLINQTFMLVSKNIVCRV